MPYQRKTRDLFAIQGRFLGRWEDVTEELTRKAGREQLRCYRENDPDREYRMVPRREKLDA